MRLTIRFLDEAGNIVFRYQLATSSSALHQAARAHTLRYRKHGVNWALDFLSELGAQCALAIEAGNGQDEIAQSAVDIAMSAFLIDTLFGGIAPQAFLRGDLLITILDDHTTTFQRITSGPAISDVDSPYRAGARA
ncbi:hypothetical protein [Ralstonia sp. 24A2]|uniref:hypothetical protein n=1 Tax=Ralstonia sp. 24A2 TaxID=3447364 RepID=UPI003F69AAC4